jgi:hypothetical protein
VQLCATVAVAADFALIRAKVDFPPAVTIIGRLDGRGYCTD